MTSAAWQLLLAAGAGAAAVSALFGLFWWLVKPRVNDYLDQLVRNTQRTAEQLQPGNTGSVADHARLAAEAVRELPTLWEHLEALEVWRTATDRRLIAFEQSLLALLGRELTGRLYEPAHHERGNTT